MILVGVPTALGLSPNPRRPDRPRGTWRAPRVLLATGLRSRLHARDAGAVPVPAYRFERDSESGIYNRAGIATQTQQIAASVDVALERGKRAVVIGGDCSVLLGAALALRRRGRYGLVFIDGHLDFRHLGNSPRLSAAAGEDLAIVTGRGLDQHANIDGLRPYFRDDDVVALGEREHDPDAGDIVSTEIRVFAAEEIQSTGAQSLAEESRAIASATPDGYWIHVDVDVLDSEVMPAVDSPQPGGLQIHELECLLRGLWASDNARGLDVTVYDPELDPDGSRAELLVTMLQHALTSQP